MIINKNPPLSYIMQKIKVELLYVVVVGIVVHVLATTFKRYLPEMPLYVPTFLGTAISILLSFKMSQSYDRWWEARKIWGSIVNDSRTLVIQLQAFLTDPNTQEQVKKIANRQIGWCYSLGQSLRSTDAMENLDKYLTHGDLQRIASHQNVPLAIIQLQAESVKEFRKNNQLDGFAHVQLDNTLVRLCDAMGKAERIKTTVFPTTYRIFLHFSIYLFVTILSVALQNVPVYYELPLLVVIAAVFFLLEKSATHLQDPFNNRPNDIPVTALATTIEINIKQLMNDGGAPKPLKQEDFYIM